MREMLSAMLGTWRQQHLPEIVANLVNWPGHEGVRTTSPRFCVTDSASLITFGSVVFEFKRDLCQELADVSARLPDYLTDRERQTGRRFPGIATYGATFIAYELRDGTLVEIGRHEPNPVRAAALLAWLEGV